jgi:hypothetical protein
MIGKKTTLNQGYIFMPYIISTNVQEVTESNFQPKTSLRNRYSSAFESKWEKRIKKIDKILQSLQKS